MNKINPLLKYKAYHADKTNITIHQYCIPLLLISSYSVFPIYVSIGINVFYSITYLLFDVFSKKSFHSVYYLQTIFLLHFPFKRYLSFHANITIHAISWILQIVAHKCFENNSPAFLDNLYDSFLFAPYFSFLETFYPCTFEEKKDKYTIIYKDEYDESKKSILYFAGLFQKAEVEYKDVLCHANTHNHIYINMNFYNNDIYKDTLVQIMDKLCEIDIECIIGFSFGGSLSLQFKELYFEKTKKEIKTILISPAGFHSNTLLENAIKIISKYLYSLYCNDKWYMIQNYPTYQNTNRLNKKDYIIVSTSDTIHHINPIQTHENIIMIKYASHLNMIQIIKKQNILSQIIKNDYQIEKVNVKPLTSHFNQLLFGSYFYPYHVTLWLSVSSYNLYYFIKKGYSYIDLGIYGIFTYVICELNEYIFHRFILHEIFYKHHDKHHTYPNKLSIIHTPMILIIILILITYAFIHIFRNPKIETISLIFGPTYYLLFEFTHLLSHNYRGSNNIILNAKQYHKLHHIDETTNYGFITPLWDYVFGTLSPKYEFHFIEMIFSFIPFYSFFIHKNQQFYTSEDLKPHAN